MAEFILSAFADEGGNTIYEQIDALKANSITHIEPRGIDGVNIADYSSAQAKELKKILDDNGIGVSAIGSPFGKIQLKDDFNVHMEKFKQTVENACILETQYIRMFSFYYDGYTAEEARDPVFERLEKMADYSLSCGVYCCHENEKDIYGDTEDRCRDILTTFKGKIKGIFDPANWISSTQQVITCRPTMKLCSGIFLRTSARHLKRTVLFSYFFGSSDISRYHSAKSASPISTMGASMSNGSGSTMSSYSTLPPAYSYAMSRASTSSSTAPTPARDRC